MKRLYHVVISEVRIHFQSLAKKYREKKKGQVQEFDCEGASVS